MVKNKVQFIKSRFIIFSIFFLLLLSFSVSSEEYNKSIELNVFKLNPALRLYKRNGFKIIEEKKKVYVMRFCSSNRV